MEEQEKISLNVFQEMLRNSWRATKIVWKEKKGSVIGLILVILVISAAPFLQSGSRGLLINELIRIVGGKPTDVYLIFLLAVLVLARLIPSLINIVEAYLTKFFWFFLEEKFEILLIKKKSDIDVAVHEDPKQNDLFNKVSESGIWRIQNFVERQFYLLQNIIEVFIAAVILISFKWWVFLIILAGTIPELIVEARYGRQVWNIHSSRAEIRRRFWDLRRHFDWLPSLVELKLFQNTRHFLSIIKELFQGFHNEEKKNERRRIRYDLLATSLSQIVIAFATIWFVFAVIHGNMLIGTLTFVLASIGDLRQSLSSFFRNLGRQFQDSLFVTDVFALLDIKPVVKKPKKGIILSPHKTPEIIFDNVAFTYQGAEKPALKDFSLVIPAGEKIALVGRNGAGKTTLVKLLCRFYDPQKGRIIIDGHDLRDINLESWYYQLGAIFQDYAQYHFIVKEAVAVGRTGQGTSLQKVKRAAKASEADIFIEEWEKGYEQMLGKEFSGGIEPSIGQWQKLALARTFYRNPQILILDEPTSSIDAEAEAKIFEKLESLPKDRTVILISHRFSTVRQANRIAVIEDGAIKELGSHEELLGLDGIYSRLFNLQAKGYR